MAPVPWETVPQETYDDMVAVLLNTLHPDVERLDGRGGEGGRRVQLERSLKRAAQLNPDSWTLVVPIDHTEGELAWFDGLRRRYRFPLVWRGRTWLDGQMATHPAIV